MLESIKVSREISKLQTALIIKAKESGLYENFGQKEVRKLRDKYGKYLYGSSGEREAYSLIQKFDEWCMNVNDNTLKHFS